MAVAAPARKLAPATAPARKPAPARKSPPARKSATRAVRAGAAAPARRAPARTAPARAKPARSPQRARPRPKRAPGGQLIPVAFGRTAGAVRHLPDSGLIVRMTRGRTWIGVLGVLLVGIVALNVVTLSFAASSGHIEQNIQALEQENPLLRARDARLSGAPRIHSEAAGQGLAMPSADLTQFVKAGPNDIATAAQRLAAAGPG
ncbi:MAG TPA: hypothetical protein VII45_03825 [Solirubrobacterales bacterium]